MGTSRYGYSDILACWYTKAHQNIGCQYVGVSVSLYIDILVCLDEFRRRAYDLVQFVDESVNGCILRISRRIDKKIMVT